MKSKISTLKGIINKTSNDYSGIEREFFKLARTNLNIEKNFPIKKFKQSTLTIVIPYFNSPKSIKYTLASLKTQKAVDFSKIEVIIIDDGSSKRKLLKLDSSFPFFLRTIRLAKNTGRVRVRNIGILLAQSDILMFLDADTLLHNMVLYNHLFVHSLLPNKNILLVGFREWVSRKDKKLKNIKRKTVYTGDIDLKSDFRIKVTYEKKHLPYIRDPSLLGKTVYVVRDTNYYKNLGFGKKYYNYSLYEQVHGFLYSLPTRLALKAGPVGETKKGWGSDDVMQAARFMGAGAKVIPLLNSRAFHLYDMDGDLNEKKRIKERLINKRRFKEQLNNPFLIFYK